MNAKVDEFLAKAKIWQEEMELLRDILLDCQLTEEFKWVKPCYSYNGNNVVILVPFKNYFALGFFKGSLLSDPDNLLVAPGENTQGGRQMRFTSLLEVQEKRAIIKQYLYESIEVEKTGMTVEYVKREINEIPQELQDKIDRDAAFKVAFEGLTPGRQRAYVMFIEQAKQSATRSSRIENLTPRILMGKGLNDCICGMTHKKPGCDGTHKYLQKS